MTAQGGMVVTFVIWFILFGLYFVPTVVAAAREHDDSTAIFALNFFLGWTFVGWVVSIVWALRGEGS